MMEMHQMQMISERQPAPIWTEPYANAWGGFRQYPLRQNRFFDAAFTCAYYRQPSVEAAGKGDSVFLMKKLRRQLAPR
jgi:hypothetical protein